MSKRGDKSTTPPVLRSSDTLQALASNLIYEVRGQKVILDADVAEFFGRSTGAVNQQRSRNKDRFPSDFAFQLTVEEWENLKSQFVISRSHGGRRTRPWAYTEHGFAMLATRLRGERAAQISKIIIDTFVSFRQRRLPEERVLTGPAAPDQRLAMRRAIYNQMQSLLSMELPTGESAASELRSVTASAIDRVKAMLDRPVKNNERLMAEIQKLQAETEQICAQTRKTDAESANLWADFYQKRLNMLAQLRDMAVQLERDELVDVLDASFGETQPPKLISTDRD